MSIRLKYVAAVALLAFAISHAYAMFQIESASRNTTASATLPSGD